MGLIAILKKWGIINLSGLELRLSFIIVNKMETTSGAYSRVPNKRTGRLFENEKKSHRYALIQTDTFINFQQKVPPIRLFPLTLLLIFVLSMAHFDLRRPQKPL